MKLDNILTHVNGVVWLELRSAAEPLPSGASQIDAKLKQFWEAPARGYQRSSGAAAGS